MGAIWLHIATWEGSMVVVEMRYFFGAGAGLWIRDIRQGKAAVGEGVLRF